VISKTLKKYSHKKIILSYHSLSTCSESKKTIDGYVSPRQRIPVSLFERQLRWISKFATFVSLNDIVNSNSSEWQVAVTFDDGYRDNAELGLPLFRRYAVPVTWFVSTRFVENPDYLPWWDLVDYMVARVRDTIEVKQDSVDRTYRFNSRKERRRFCEDMRRAFRSAELSSQEVLYESLRKECSRFVSIPPNAFADKALVSRAACSPWISVGAHTVTHPNLSKVSSSRLKYEVRRGRRLLQDWTGEAVDWFAYPYGGKSTRNAGVRRVLNKTGFRGAVTTTRGYVPNDPDLFKLPRFMVPVWAGMAGFKAGVLGLNQVEWFTRKADWSMRWLRNLLRSF
jgi:peptidoglycan/xylan/chitin deacetylase (PgdA/CDA1 family)